jgi:ABC-2 type transport system permease protein
MLADDLRCLGYIALKDLKAYYLKPPNISWGILLPFAFVLAFAIRNPGDWHDLLPGLVGLSLLFGTSTMEATVIVFERRTGALERLLLAPVRLPALLFGKLLGGAMFGLVMTAVVLVVGLAAFGAGNVRWPWLVLTLLVSALAFAALGAFVSVAVKEIFEAQTLANFFRFPMMFLSGVFVPLAGLPAALQVLARLLPLTYTIEALQASLYGGPVERIVLDLLVLAAFATLLFALALRTLAQRLA